MDTKMCPHMAIKYLHVNTVLSICTDNDMIMAGITYQGLLLFPLELMKGGVNSGTKLHFHNNVIPCVIKTETLDS